MFTVDHSKTFLKVIGIGVASGLSLAFINRLYNAIQNSYNSKSLTYALKQMYKENNIRGQFNKVIFFPDPGLACRRMLSGRTCRDQNCAAVHSKTSLSVLLDVLNFTKRTLDVCIYMITSSILGDALIECQQRGIILRIITEERNSGEEGEMSGSQIGKLRAAGVPVRCKASSFWMHHKFIVADREVLVNGSFNWTNQAVMGNSENLVITSEKSLVNPFIGEFQKLWDSLNSFDFLEDEDIKNCNILV